MIIPKKKPKPIEFKTYSDCIGHYMEPAKLKGMNKGQIRRRWSQVSKDCDLMVKLAKEKLGKPRIDKSKNEFTLSRRSGYY
jgi:hypothetical protein